MSNWCRGVVACIRASCIRFVAVVQLLVLLVICCRTCLCPNDASCGTNTQLIVQVWGLNEKERASGCKEERQVSNPPLCSNGALVLWKCVVRAACTCGVCVRACACKACVSDCAESECALRNRPTDFSLSTNCTYQACKAWSMHGRTFSHSTCVCRHEESIVDAAYQHLTALLTLLSFFPTSHHCLLHPYWRKWTSCSQWETITCNGLTLYRSCSCSFKIILISWIAARINSTPSDAPIK